MLKFRIRQAGGCGRRPKNAKPTTKPNVQTQKKAQGPRNPPEAPPRPPGGARRHPGGARRPPGGPREAQRRPKTRKVTAKTRAPEAPKAPRGPGGPRTVSELRRPRQEKPTTFPEDPERVSKRSRQDLGSKPGRYGGSGNLGRQPETRKGIKLGGCLRKQGVGKRNQHTSSWFVAHERCAVA